jgi:hypothetical protein
MVEGSFVGGRRVLREGQGAREGRGPQIEPVIPEC